MENKTEWIFDYSLLDQFDRPFLYCDKCQNSVHPTENTKYHFCPVCGVPHAQHGEMIKNLLTEFKTEV